MPRVAQRVNFNDFRVGKISDSNPINPVPGGLRTALNVDIALNGRAGRRLGLEVEDDFNFPYSGGSWLAGYTTDDLLSSRLNNFEWVHPNEDADTYYRVFRIGNALYFYDDTAIPLSSGYLGYAAITAHIASGSSSAEAANASFYCVAGKGVLFCTGRYYNPFYIEYSGGSFNTVSITPQIRDFEGLDDGLETAENPVALSVTHQYNLYNQGWPDYTVRDTSGNMKLPHEHYKTQQGVYPSNAEIWYFGQTPDGTLIKFNSHEMKDDFFGNTNAPKGHLILTLLSTTARRDASGLSGISSETVSSFRAEAIAFYAGRLWLGNYGNKILYSKIIENLEDVDIYYQAQDPTAEDLNELLATDGGYLSAIDIGYVYHMETFGRALVIFSANGIFSVSGTDGAFTATNQTKTQVSPIVVSSPDSIIKAQDGLYFWSLEGIFKITEDPATGFLVTQDISKNRISVDYEAIPVTAKQTAQGIYDRPNQKIYWAYSYHTTDLGTDIANKYTDILVYNILLNAFWDYRLSNDGYTDANTDYPIVTGLFRSTGSKVDSVATTVVASADTVVASADTVIVNVSFQNFGNPEIKTMVFLADSASAYRFTFGQFTSRDFFDWVGLTDADITANVNYTPSFPVKAVAPGDYSSVIEPLPETLGEPSLRRGATYLHTYYDYRRGGFNQPTTPSEFDA